MYRTHLSRGWLITNGRGWFLLTEEEISSRQQSNLANSPVCYTVKFTPERSTKPIKVVYLSLLPFVAFDQHQDIGLPFIAHTSTKLHLKQLGFTAVLAMNRLSNMYVSVVMWPCYCRCSHCLVGSCGKLKPNGPGLSCVRTGQLPSGQ